MFRTFVVPLDGSGLAERALPYAVRLAQTRQGRLILMRAALAAPPRTLDGSDWELEQLRATDEAERYLNQLADTISSQVAVDTVAVSGRAAAQILETASRFAADGIVMATHGRTGLPHLLYGSVTEAMLANSPLPVFVVYARPGEAPATPFAPYTARVLVPQDGSPYDAPSVEAALQILGLRGELILVTVIPAARHVMRDEGGNVLAYLDQQEEASGLEARERLDRTATAMRERQLPIPIKVDVRIGDPASGIAMAAIDNSADLIVMSTHGRTGVRRAILGSVAGTVLRSGPTPVLLVHPQAAASTQTAKSDAAVFA